MLNHRCTICNSVSSSEIQNAIGDLNKDSYVPDTKGQGFICSKCDGIISNLHFEYEADDDVMGWEFVVASDDDDKINLDNEPEE